MSHLPAVVIAGPTGVGKTDLAVSLAEALCGRLQAEVVNVDSRQIYRGMDVGTAKPTAAERAAVVHHLVDVADPDQTWSAGRYAAAARAAVAEVRSRGCVPLLVGGSGLYLQALVDGLFSGDTSDPALRAELEARCRRDGLASLWEQLGRLDPAARQALSPRDEVRILRALELALGDRGTRADRWSGRRQTPLPGPCIWFALERPRGELYRRIDLRVAAMGRAGWLAEVEALLAAGWSRQAPGLQTLGYAELAAHLLDGADLEDALETIRRRTRRYAKRQMTWFRRDRRLRWLDLDHLPVPAAAQRLASRVRAVAAQGATDRPPIAAACVDSGT